MMATTVLLAAALSGLASLAAQGLLQPPPHRLADRHPGSLRVHLGTVGIAYTALLAIGQRPILAAGALIAIELVVIQCSNIKWRTLREPLVCQDTTYFLDAIRFPRLFVPFFGIARAIAAITAAVVAIGSLLWAEPSLWAAAAGASAPQAALLLGAIAGLLLASLAALERGLARLPEPSLEPSTDLARYGLHAHLWACARRLGSVPDTSRQPSVLTQAPAPATPDSAHVVLVQSEAFFDPRTWSKHIHPDLLPAWDELRAGALDTGRLTVPAWGANTVRTEAAVLTGLDEQALGVHRFNPYIPLARRSVPSLAHHLGRAGYRTVFIHPYPARFYQRHRVVPNLGFEAFIDARAFAGAPIEGQYVSDRAVGDYVADLLGAADQRPLFLFVVTMENHGPIHLERSLAKPEGDPRVTPDGLELPPGCEDLLIYCRHLRHADQMLGTLMQALRASPRPGLLGWYGDHVPAMPDVYERLGAPAGHSHYALWATGATAARQPNRRDLQASMLGAALLERRDHLEQAHDRQPHHAN